MRGYGYGALMGDYVFLEDLGRKVKEWGRDIGKRKYQVTERDSVGGSLRARLFRFSLRFAKFLSSGYCIEYPIIFKVRNYKLAPGLRKEPSNRSAHIPNIQPIREGRSQPQTPDRRNKTDSQKRIVSPDTP